jgi:hypothetical protein
VSLVEVNHYAIAVEGEKLADERRWNFGLGNFGIDILFACFRNTDCASLCHSLHRQTVTGLAITALLFHFGLNPASQLLSLK